MNTKEDASDTGKPAPTPETDAVLAEIIDTVRVDHDPLISAKSISTLVDFAHNLERQRDALEAALRELVELKDLKERDVVFDGDAYQDYAKRKPLAWEAARAALSLVERKQQG